jgi:acid phosphatase
MTARTSGGARAASTGRRRLLRLAALTTMAMMGACGPGLTGDTRGPAVTSPATETTSPAPTSPAPTSASGVTKVLTIVLENHGSAAVTAGMPALVGLARTYGQASHYRAATHPSLPNYLTLAGGTAAGVTDDGSPSAHALHGPSVFDLAIGAGRSARTYAEAMPTHCARENQGRYAVRHNPWAYFADDASRRACAIDDVPLGTPTSGALVDDIAGGTLPAVGLIVPDLCNDAHNCPLSTADAWVSDWVSRVLQGPDWRAGRLALVVTFDEAETSSDTNTVLTVVIAPGLHGVVADAPLTHQSWTRWMSDLTGSAAPGDATSLGAAFGL